MPKPRKMPQDAPAPQSAPIPPSTPVPPTTPPLPLNQQPIKPFLPPIPKPPPPPALSITVADACAIIRDYCHRKRQTAIMRDGNDWLNWPTVSLELQALIQTHQPKPNP